MVRVIDRLIPWDLFSRNFENKASSVFNFFSPKIETSQSFETAFKKKLHHMMLSGKKMPRVQFLTNELENEFG